MRKTLKWFAILAWSMMIFSAFAEQTLHATLVSQPPEIDGNARDSVWANAPTITTMDRVAGIPVKLQAVHDNSNLFLKVVFPDKNETREHKTLVWDKTSGIYRTSFKREDFFVIKWNMNPFPVDLTLSSDQSYKADIWYWKAYRTDHAGYADDKYQLYSTAPTKKAQRLYSKQGNTFYLARRGDAGQPAYSGTIFTEYVGDEVAGIKQRSPQGSRADVRAKGHWKNGYWTIEFARALDTGHGDDILLSRERRAQFGISRYEVAGREPNPTLDQPLAGSGEVGETLFLQLK
ncbi:MAG: hypothetical protein HN421_02470 [Gammaproteobacteria bacterium]|jgi:hypothetical protein|nr:hypothetical protein [Gammaproteobacteria bacterium]MBT3718461.1 hypothetical protein [Gammaproteobacteria bacterium]MBT5370748.1 hypothetical protein [Gammaproteobacteria bacterium]MBT6478147.1 hypothetical protein [Gammaproteobacteria bacterium]MBT6651697.1 hypothetical protein [Gammaproteobacteria bacterium]